ncbi:MAG: HIT family protein [Congregibacter sp.]
MATQWQLHPTLAADCHAMGEARDITLLLHRNAVLHWFILVPHTEVMDLLDLQPGRRSTLLDTAESVSRYLKTELDYPRVNVGALGLVVPQLHLHVIGRREDDPCWPAPVWGNLTEQRDHEPEQLAVISDALRDRLALE